MDYFLPIKDFVNKRGYKLSQDELNLLLIKICSFKDAPIEDIKYLVEKGASLDNNSLLFALQFNNLDIAKYLVEKGADLDKAKNKVLYSSVTNGYFEIVKYLIENGANINLLKDYILEFESQMKIVEYIKSKY